MKKLYATIALFFMAFSFVACGGNNTFIETTTKTTAETTLTTEEVTTTQDTTVTITTTEDTVTTVDTLTTVDTSNTDTGSTTTVPLKETYVFEAEYTYLDELIGATFSGSTFGTALIVDDMKNGGASNGYYVSYLYTYGITLTFNFNSDRAATNASLYMRLSAEYMDFTLTSSMFAVVVNNTQIAYNDISFINVPGVNSETIYPFTDFYVGKVSLLEGANVVKLIVTNNTAMVGTMYSTAPMVDCIKIETEAVLTWTPLTDNIQ